jgi:hypothetical protein
MKTIFGYTIRNRKEEVDLSWERKVSYARIKSLETKLAKFDPSSKKRDEKGRFIDTEN